MGDKPLAKQVRDLMGAKYDPLLLRKLFKDNAAEILRALEWCDLCEADGDWNTANALCAVADLQARIAALESTLALRDERIAALEKENRALKERLSSTVPTLGEQKRIAALTEQLRAVLDVFVEWSHEADGTNWCLGEECDPEDDTAFCYLCKKITPVYRKAREVLDG